MVRVDVRVVAATNRDLEEEIEAGRFREDLFYRLNVVPMRTPPLRERLEDIPLLVEHFARRFAEAAQLPAEARSRPRRSRCSQALPWQGNVRELRNLVERLLILAPGDDVERARTSLAAAGSARVELPQAFHGAQDAARVPRPGREALHPPEARGARLERDPDRAGDRHAAQQPLQEDGAVRDPTRRDDEADEASTDEAGAMKAR